MAVVAGVAAALVVSAGGTVAGGVAARLGRGLVGGEELTLLLRAGLSGVRLLDELLTSRLLTRLFDLGI